MPVHGDLSTNLAMKLAGPLKQKPRAVADTVVSRPNLPVDVVSRVEIAGRASSIFWLAGGQLAAGFAGNPVRRRELRTQAAWEPAEW